ncbi:antibiotic biosynthesis monooxygenase family protein [Adhaeribacter soli]|uniref:Antibiotic biosynthesis monooxygenase n=1 Tax=Adhaeribacter soli TaxID=2607655 RepID=A0A5N1IRL1_9BACT|nr:antibiotic biosynthesis monooxygenase [Adhaeribacter soli]KAA9332805.1 antibiotic biosynthesis monooxygenase [Adhaeribacter soli]
MFIALSTFTIANNMAPEVKKAFQERPHLVDNAPGYRKMEVLCPQDAPNEIWLITYWTDEESYQVWHKNHLRESHSNIPKGLKLVPRSAKVRFFTHIAD